MFRTYALIVLLIGPITLSAWSEELIPDAEQATPTATIMIVPQISLDTIQPEKSILPESEQRIKGILTVQITQLRNNKGNLKVSVFDKPDGFPMGGKNALRNLVVKIENQKAIAVFENLPLGSYAVSVWHDENGDEKMNTNWIGMPIEGLGVSRDAKGSFGPPKYRDARFDFNTKALTILIQAIYL